MKDSMRPEEPGVKGARPYDASRRRERALASRRAVVAAAGELLLERGYAATTVAAVARAAGVSPESVYKGFGAKVALFKAVLDVALAGDDEPVPVAQRPEMVAIRDEPDGRVKLRMYAAEVARRNEQSGRLQLVLRDAAAGDAALAGLWAELQQERLVGMTMLARHLDEAGVLRVEVDQARDVLWATIAVEVYDLLVLQRGWSAEAYGAWVATTLVAALL